MQLARKPFWVRLMKLLGDVSQVEACSFRLEIVLILVQNRCTDWDEHTIGSKIILDIDDGTPW
jgi:hypothetical protein